MNKITILKKELGKLQEEQKILKKCLDTKFYNDNKRTEIFNKIKKCKFDIEKIKFKIRMEKKLNENNNTN